MSSHQWPAETKRRAETAMTSLERFYETIRESTAAGRRQEMYRFSSIRSELAFVTEANDYVMSNLSRLATVCDRLARLRQPRDFNERDEVARGLGDVSNVRSWMHRLGLLEDECRT